MIKFKKGGFSLGWFLYRFRKYIVPVIIALSVAAFFYLPNLQFKVDFSKFLPEGNADLAFYEEYSSKFGGREDQLFIGIYRSEGVFERTFLEKVASFSDSCRAIDLISRTYSILNLSEVHNTPFGPLVSPYLDLSKDRIFNRDSLKLINHPLAKGQLLSPNGKALIVSVKLKPDLESEASHAVVGELNELLEDFDFEESHMVGILNIEANHVQMAAKELFFFIKVCIVLIIILLLIVYRSIPAMLLPLVIFLLSTVFLGAILALLGITLDTISTMLPAIVLIVSISDVVHLFAKMQGYNQSDLKPLIQAIDEVAKTNFLTSLTSAIGFFTLVISPMPTLVDFGISVGLGVLIAYVLSIIIVPITFFLLPFRLPSPQGIFSKAKWEQLLSNHLFKLIKKPNPIFIGLTFFIILSILGISAINYDRYMVSTMPFDHEVRDSYTFFEEQFGGSREFDLAIIATEKGGLQQLDNLEFIDRLHSHLDSIAIVGNTISTATYFKLINNISFARNRNEYSLPESQEQLNRLSRRAPYGIKYQFRSVIDSSMTYGAIRGRMGDVGMIQHQKMMAELDAWIIKHQTKEGLEFRHTGIPMILDKINRLAVEANFVGLLIAAIFISLLMALVFRNRIYILLVVTLNLLPLVLLAGVVGFMGIELRGSISLVFSVAFVIIVDDTIHFLNNFQLKINAGQEVASAIRETMQHTGHAIFLTTVLLTVVTLSLTWSSIPDIYYLGVLLSFTLVFALIFDIVLIPVLLWVIYRSPD
jgi:predicted RND superfamily exporter protein